MGYDLQVIFKNKNRVKYGSRNIPNIVEKEVNEDENNNHHQNHKYTTYFHIDSDWWKSDVETWPEDLRFWYYHINTPDDAKQHAVLFRKYYDNDIDLLRLAEWLDYWSQYDIKFDLSR